MLTSALAFATGLGTTVARAQTYPFAGVPATVNASFNVKLGSGTSNFNNDLLGTNIFKFTTEEDKAFIRKLNPRSIRFPHGLFANWYDYKTDGTRIYGDPSWPIDQKTPIQTFQNSGAIVGIAGLTSLNNEYKNSHNGVGYDMLWTFNMSEDGINFNNGSPRTVERYLDIKRRGLEIKDIELGNENFYRGQRSSIIPTHVEYIKRAKSMSAALKAQDPNIKVSIPLLRRASASDPKWNSLLTADSSYFDAVTVHLYVGFNPDNEGGSSDAFSEVLNARNVIKTAINTYVRPYSTKPIWLSEWGVKSIDANGGSVLGMADAYIYLSENQNIFSKANWFSVNGVLNSHVVVGADRQVVMPLKKTAFGAGYQIIRSMFENSGMYQSTMTTHKLKSDLNAVSARAFKKNNQVSILAVNLTNKSVKFEMRFNNTAYTGAYTLDAMKYSSLGETRNLGIDASPYNHHVTGNGVVTLPPLSINRISGLKITPP